MGFKKVSTFYMKFARERIIRRFINSNVSAGNMLPASNRLPVLDCVKFMDFSSTCHTIAIVITIVGMPGFEFQFSKVFSFW